jgi:chromosome segregation ATPase
MHLGIRLTGSVCYQGKNMKNIVVAFLAIGLIVGVVSYTGCGPRGAVITKNVMDKIDKMLGELNVKQEQINAKYNEAKKIQAEVREKRISTEVRLGQTEKRKAALDEKIKVIEGQLVKVQELLKEVETSGEITRNGKTYTKEEIKHKADDLINEHKAAKGDMSTAINSTIESSKRMLEFLKKQESTAGDALAKLEQKITELKSKKESIEFMKTNSSIISDDASFMTKIESLTKDVDDFDVDIETMIRSEEEKMKDFVKNNSTIDELFAEPADLNSTINEIDSILGKGKEDQK